LTSPALLCGAPEQLTCKLALEPMADSTRAQVPAQPTATLEGAEVQRVTVFASSAGAPELRVSLRTRPTTPPGRYAGSLQFGDRTIPIEAEVEPSARMECEPARLALDVQPRGLATAELRLINRGNVPFTIPVSSTFGLFDGDGIHHAVWVALTGEPTPEKQRIDLLLDDLAESHGGLVRVRAAKGQDPILPGEARVVQIRLRFSDRLQHPRRYGGVWEVDGLQVPVLVTAVAPERASAAGERSDEGATGALNGEGDNAPDEIDDREQEGEHE